MEEKQARTLGPDLSSVELPGIEPVTETNVTCGNAETNYAKLRETTCGYAKGVDGVNTRGNERPAAPGTDGRAVECRFGLVRSRHRVPSPR
jgi:hypothetical protein